MDVIMNTKKQAVSREKQLVFSYQESIGLPS